MTMPSVASLFGSDLVSGALKSTLNQVQNNCSFLNFNQLSKKERRKEKKIQRKLERRYGVLGKNKQPYQALLNSSPNKKSESSNPDSESSSSVSSAASNNTRQLSVSVVSADANSSSSDLSDSGEAESWMSDNPPLEFDQAGPQVSEFTLNLRGKYASINESDVDSRMEVAPAAENGIQNSQEKVIKPGSSSPKTFGTVQEASDILPPNDLPSLVKNSKKEEENDFMVFSPPKSVQKQQTNNCASDKNISKVQNGTPASSLDSKNGVESSKTNGENGLKHKDKNDGGREKGQPEAGSSNGHHSSTVRGPVASDSLISKKMVQTNIDSFLKSSSTKNTLFSKEKKEMPKGEPSDKEHSKAVQIKKVDPNIVRLPEPKHVLYERKKIRPNWRTKLPVGCGFINLGNTCYMNATLQALYHTPAFLNWLLDEYNDKEHKERCERNHQSSFHCTICPMVTAVFGVYNRQGNPFRPVQIHNKLRSIGKNFSYGRQEDAHEFLRLLLESMERSYLTAVGGQRLDNRSKETTPLGQIFGGYTRGEVRCLTCRHVSTTFHPHAELQLDIREVNNVEDALAFYFQKEKLDNNDYKCEKCKTVQPATKQQFMELAPIVLCIQLKRFRACGSKIKKPIFINETLNLNRFMHDRKNERNPEAQYRLVGLVTHMGPSPNCGHYTAIAQAANGNYYQFDDSYVRMTSLNHAQNADAYVIIYETTNRKNIPVPSSSTTSPSSHAPHFSPGSVTNGSKLVTSNNSPRPVATTSPAKPSQTGSQPRSLEQTNSDRKSNELTPNKIHNSSNGKPATNNTNKPFSNPFVKKTPPVSNGMGIKKFSINSNSPALGPSAKIFSGNQSSSASAMNKSNHSSPLKNNAPNRYFLNYGNNAKPNSNLNKPRKLVPYEGSDDESDDDTKKPVAPANNENNQSASKTAADNSKPKVYQTPSAPQIKSWNSNEESKLGQVIEADRKRPFMKSKEEREDEDIDSGRAKKKPKPEGPENSKMGVNPFDKATRIWKD